MNFSKTKTYSTIFFPYFARIFIFLIIFGGIFGVAGKSEAATYYVDKDNTGGICNDSNSGTTTASPWCTIGKANATLSAGDTVFISAGTYEEAVSPARSGDADGHISYIAKTGEFPVIRQVYLQGDDYIRVSGFEITHSGISFTHAVTFYNANHCEILNSNIHNINGQGIRNNDYYGNSNHNVIRGNTFSWIGCPSNAPGSCVGGTGIGLRGHYNLIEYNSMAHTLDFINMRGSHSIIRNNYLHDFQNSDFPDGNGDTNHVDIFQPYGLEGEDSTHNIYENNWASDNLEANSHYFQIRDESVAGENEFIIRGNIGARMGSYVAGFGAIDFVRMYNNTFVDFDGWALVGYSAEPPPNGNPSVNNFNFNNVYYQDSIGTRNLLFYVADGCEVDASHNACENSGSDSSCLVTSGINFSNYASDDFQPNSTSSVLDSGRIMTTITSESGNGTIFSVEDAGFFSDGYGITPGDLIKVGQNNSVRIGSIDSGANTITVNESISWIGGDAVTLSYQDDTPDIGAFEYKSSGYALSGSWNKADSTVTVVPNDSSLVRFVEVFEDGVSVGTSYAEPWSVDGVEDGIVTVKMYSYFPSKTPVIDAILSDTDTTPPSSPSGLSVY